MADLRLREIREGFDCVLRAGPVSDPGLIARPLGHFRMINCASSAYLQAHGIPKTLADLASHRLVHYVNTLGAKSGGFDYVAGDEDCRLPMAGAVTVNNAEAYTAA